MTEEYLVEQITEPVDWKVAVPGSKSMTNRALLLAALSVGTVRVEGVLFSDDSRHFLDCLKSLGFAVQIEEEKKCVTLTGCGGEIPFGEAVIDVGSAGTAARFLAAMLGFSDGCYEIRCSKQMKRRPMAELFYLLSDAGAKITFLEEKDHLPVRICGCRYHKEIRAAVQDGHETPSLSRSFALDISKSTQFLSALLLIAPMIPEGMNIHITSEKTDGSYIRITRKMLQEFGVDVAFDGKNYKVPQRAVYQKNVYTVEPDMSAACYFYAAAAVTGGRALVKHVHLDNTQGDLRFLEVLKNMGCTVDDTQEGVRVTGPLDGRLKGIAVNMNDFSDQALTLAAIAPFADAPVRIEGIAHIRGQECDRIRAIVTNLTKLGIRCEEEEAAVTVYPGKPHGGCVETYEDHRVAMAFSLIGLKTDGIIIENPLCCRKTFENYFSLLSELTGKKG